jgi:hypothetical protein
VALVRRRHALACALAAFATLFVTSAAAQHGGSVVGPAPGSTDVVIRTVFGLVLLLGLASLGAHPRIRRWEERAGISQLLTTGLPFVALGLIARSPGVSVLTPEVLEDLAPLLHLGLGWIGFLTGFSFRLSALEEGPRGGAAVVLSLAGVPALLVALACGGILIAVQVELDRATIVRDAVLIGLAGSLAAPSVGATLERAGAAPSAAEDARRIAKFEALAAVIGLAIVSAYDRPRGAHLAWTLPAIGWLFVTLGMSATVGVLAWIAMRRPMAKADSQTLLLGVVALASGMAGYLKLCALVICFLAGLALRNLPGAHYEGVVAALERFERPVYLTFLAVVGAIWDVDDWRGWALIAPFVVARIAGRWIGVHVARRARRKAAAPELGKRGTVALVLAPMSPLAIALIVSVSTLYLSTGVRLSVTPVLVGAVVHELRVHATAREERAA